MYCWILKKITNYLLTTYYSWTGEYFRNTIVTDNVLSFLLDKDNVLDGKAASTSSTTASGRAHLQTWIRQRIWEQPSRIASQIACWMKKVTGDIHTRLFVSNLQTVQHDLEHDTILISIYLFFCNFELRLSFRLDAVVAAAGGYMDY